MREHIRKLRFLWACLAVTLLLIRPGYSAPDEKANLADLLARAAQNAKLFVEHFSSVKCTERVQQTKLGAKERIEAQEDSTFDYLLLLDVTGGDIRLEESRLLLQEKSPARKSSLLVTNGFSTLLLIFHPVYQPSFEFALEAAEAPAAESRVRVHFRHLPGTRSPAVLFLRGREFPLSLEGTAWLDPQTGDVTRIEAGLAGSMEDIGLVKFQSDVAYARIHFQSEPRPYWLPSSAVIEVHTPRQRWRNSHQFTDYKLFSVSATSSVGQTP
ncbi:MAG TPA: hypothetical protein VNL38_01060 [Candidatus Nitrosotenuis sp.]|nr:hypothetical protein [Candidatus Nitrosotenuis sp.]